MESFAEAEPADEGEGEGEPAETEARMERAKMRLQDGIERRDGDDGTADEIGDGGRGGRAHVGAEMLGGDGNKNGPVADGDPECKGESVDESRARMIEKEKGIREREGGQQENEEHPFPVARDLAGEIAGEIAEADSTVGPLHGGANQEVIEMLEMIRADGSNVAKYVDLAKRKESGFRMMGFGHRVYKNFDPRARIIKEAADKMLGKLGIHDPLLDIAKRLEEAALKDSYFVERKLYPNVDFYSGIIYRALGFPTNMFTVLFALGRLPGWTAHWKEMMEDPTTKIGRPRQIYTGSTLRNYVPMEQRPR